MCWQLKEKTDKFEAEQAKKKAEFKSGKVIGRVSTKHSVFFVCVFCCYKNTTSIYRSVGAINVARGEAALSSAARRSPWQLSYSSQFTY